MLDHKEILDLRSKHLGPSLSVSYDEPLHIVRGEGQYLFDAKGNRYLDCVNNIQHVGHCHPKVVEAAQQQYKKLNTNTRYLDETIVNYAKDITSTLPDGLEVCFFANSGSEANDLALRLVRQFTGDKATIVLDGAYHGNLFSLIEISPYKHNGPGGNGAPDFVYTLPMPDSFRGKYLGEDCGEKYAQEVQAAINEIQIGFGRVGSHFWGFETYGVIPDIVTMGKSMGNGHPLSAVVTTREIADSFNNGMEYFNSFGGNPVSCAVGQAVLDVIKEEGLQENALEVGSYLLNQLKNLQNQHDLIGEVRGRGLFIGIELVKDELVPAAAEAQTIVNHMKDKGLLLSTDGPDHNVIKIKPPLVFNKKNADELVEKLDETMSE